MASDRIEDCGVDIKRFESLVEQNNQGAVAYPDGDEECDEA